MGGLSPAQCEKMVDHSRRRSPFVRFMLDKMEEFGCAVPKRCARAARHDGGAPRAARASSSARAGPA